MGETLNIETMGTGAETKAAQAPELAGKGWLEKTKETIGKGAEFIGNAGTLLLGTAMMEIFSKAYMPGLEKLLQNTAEGIPGFSLMAIGLGGAFIFGKKLMELQKAKQVK